MVEKDKHNQKQMFCSWLFKIQTQIRVRCFGVTLNVRFIKKMSNMVEFKISAKGKKTKIPTQHHQLLTASYYKYLAAVLAAKDGTIINC